MRKTVCGFLMMNPDPFGSVAMHNGAPADRCKSSHFLAFHQKISIRPLLLNAQFHSRTHLPIGSTVHIWEERNVRGGMIFNHTSHPERVKSGCDRAGVAYFGGGSALAVKILAAYCQLCGDLSGRSEDAVQG